MKSQNHAVMINLDTNYKGLNAINIMKKTSDKTLSIIINDRIYDRLISFLDPKH